MFEHFAVEVTTFLNCLNEFPEFTDEAVNASIRSFEGDLKVGLGVASLRIDVSCIVCSIGHRV